ncbi:uncharacterized protein F54H12.2 [Trichonephila inaurata madagascariensis]|uniref:Uncharacterized protein F54H12.2 n=1 Tax=Trichonephila inaurata madagascariensis TaxID=2747483 RepID=A0A8X6YAK1_9ARAC|nr:uncharacterized protein F54H12.2 [Trichonephila inaurata madagascariensis]
MSVPYVCCTKRFEDHYASQIGSGLTHYKGINFQKRYGIGGIFRRLLRAALPFLVKGGKTIGKEVLMTGSRVVSDVLSGENFKETVKTRSRESGKKLAQKAIDKVQSMVGKGQYKRKRKKQKKFISSKARKELKQLFKMSSGNNFTLSNVFDNAPVEFHVSGSAEDYIDLSKTQLYVKAKIVKVDNTPITEDDTIRPVNLFFYIPYFLKPNAENLFVACVDNEASHGAFSKSPYELKHFNLNFIGEYVDGPPVPHNPLELDFSKDQYIRAYQTLFVGTDRMGQDTVLSQEKTTSPYFQGVYSRDTLPPLQENMCAIVNSDDSSQPGTHWLALFVNDKRELEFYDSFGQPPVFYNISTTTYLDVLWNSKVFQSPTSNVKIVCEFCGTPFTLKDTLLHHLNNRNCERKLEKEAGKRKRVDLTVSSKKKKTQLSTSAENSAATPKNSTTVPEHSAVPENSMAVPEKFDVVPEKIFLPPKESENAFQKHIKLLIFPITIVHWG